MYIPSILDDFLCMNRVLCLSEETEVPGRTLMYQFNEEYLYSVTSIQDLTFVTQNPKD